MEPAHISRNDVVYMLRYKLFSFPYISGGFLRLGAQLIWRFPGPYVQYTYIYLINLKVFLILLLLFVTVSENRQIYICV